MSVTQAVDQNGNIIPGVFKYSTFQAVAYDASVQSAALAAGTRIVRLVSTTNCHFVVAADPTATTDDAYLPANVPLFIQVEPGHEIAAIKAAGASAGVLSIGEVA